MSIVLWDERFATGSSTLDHQHRVLMDHVNHLAGMLTNTNPTLKECDFLIHLVDFLESYAASHFKFEEQCMESYRCPAHARNKEAHGQFMSYIQEFNRRFRIEGF